MQEDAAEIKQANIKLPQQTNCRASFSAIRVKPTIPLPVTVIMDKREHCFLFWGLIRSLPFWSRMVTFSSSKLHLMSERFLGFLGGEGGMGLGQRI